MYSVFAFIYYLLLLRNINDYYDVIIILMIVNCYATKLTTGYIF